LNLTFQKNPIWNFIVLNREPPAVVSDGYRILPVRGVWGGEVWQWNPLNIMNDRAKNPKVKSRDIVAAIVAVLQISFLYLNLVSNFHFSPESLDCSQIWGPLLFKGTDG